MARRVTELEGAARLLLLVVVALGALGCSPGAPAGAADAGPADVSPGPGPYLASLDVTSSNAGAPPSLLVPAFRPDAHDYYVRCAAGDNALTVSAAAEGGAESRLVLPRPSSPSASISASVVVKENDAIVVAVSRGAASQEYWVRCLPHDFPPLVMVRHGGAAPPDGYYLLATSRAPLMAAWSYAIVLDANAVPVWYVHGPKGEGVQNVDAVVPGAISFLPQSSPIEIHHLDPLRTTFPSPTGAPHDQHDLRVLGNGHYLLVSPLLRAGVDLSGVDVTLPDGGVEALGPGMNAIDCDLVEFDPATGKVYWKWIGSQHFSPQKDAIDPEVARGPGGSEEIDMFHCNSIDVDPENGNLLVSSRDLNSIFYVEYPSGKILWKMGGKTYTTDAATYVPVDDPFYRQHDARLLPGFTSSCFGGRGQISLFDDYSSEPGPARALVLDVVVDPANTGKGGCGAPGVTRGGATVAWQYRGQTNSSVMGSFRISADGSRVIGWGASASATSPVFTEVDEHGTDLLDFYFASGEASYRVVKVPKSALDLALLRSTAGR